MARAREGGKRGATKATLAMAQLLRLDLGLAMCLIALASCSTTNSPGGCPGSCTETRTVQVSLACATATVTNVQLTGPCAPESDASLYKGFAPDASVRGQTLGLSCASVDRVPFSECQDVFFTTAGPGECHLALTFANGFTFASDVTWESEVQNCGCPALLVPSQPVVHVDNPESTCSSADAGGE